MRLYGAALGYERDSLIEVCRQVFRRASDVGQTRVETNRLERESKHAVVFGATTIASEASLLSAATYLGVELIKRRRRSAVRAQLPPGREDSHSVAHADGGDHVISEPRAPNRARGRRAMSEIELERLEHLP